MANNAVVVGGLKVRTFEITESSGPYSGSAVEMEAIVQVDPTTGLGAAVTQLHTGFNQPIPGGGSTLQAGVAQIQNASGKLDPSFEAGQDGLPARGLPATVTNLAQKIATISTANQAASPTAAVTLPVASSVGFVVGGIAIIDSSASGVQEAQVITAVPDSTHITVDHLANAHNGSVTAFPVVQFLYNQERDAAGELDVAPGVGAATAIEYEYDGITYLRGRNVFGVSGLYTDSVAASASASTIPVVLTVAGTPPANLQVGHALVIDPLGANPEVQQITAINAGAKQITVAQLTYGHTGTFRVFAAIQSLSAAPQNVSGVGVAAEAAMLYSGQNSTTGVQQFSVEKDINAVGTALPISSTVGSAGAAGIDADCEFGVVDTTARTFAGGTLVPDQHGQGGEDLVTVGGRVTGTVAAGTGTANSVVKSTAGRLCRVLITAAGTAAMNLYDNASAASGTIVCAIPANAAVGTIYDLQMPCANGITAGQVNGSPALTVSYY